MAGRVLWADESTARRRSYRAAQCRGAVTLGHFSLEVGQKRAQWLVNYFGRLTVDQTLECLKEMVRNLSSSS